MPAAGPDAAEAPRKQWGSPMVGVRISPALRDRIHEIASQEGESVSTVIRRTLETVLLAQGVNAS